VKEDTRMSQELGKITKPEVSSLKEGRKLFVVPLLYSGKDAPADYLEKHDLYWKQVAEHLNNLESKVGAIKHIYHETINLTGDEGLKLLEKLNPKSYEIIKKKCQDKARLEVVEDKELAEECMDWERCLIMGFISDKVAQQVSGYYLEASRKRFDHISKKIDETLSASEVGVLFIREGHLVQFTRDIEIFSVAPPALDDIHRWLRDHSKTRESDEEPAK
jgi:hypothetical protein